MRAHLYMAMAIALALVAGVIGALRLWSDDPAAARGSAVQIGIQDDRLAQPTANAGERVGLIDGLGAKLVRVDLRWDLVATRRPAKAADPADPAYNWTQYDAVVAAARSRKIRVLFTLWGTPRWAADPTVKLPLAFKDSPWAIRPARAADVGAFAAAAARRYSPRGVHLWEGWNEPNIGLFLYPQIERRKGGSGFVVTSPRTYSAIQKAVYRSIKNVDRGATVAGLVTAPAGDPFPATAGKGTVTRVPPRDFLQRLNAKSLRPPMDAVSHHPYPNRVPKDAINPTASYVDLYSLSQLVGTVDAGYLKGKSIWVTEFGIATAQTPQYPYFRSRPLQAEYLTDAVRRVRANPRVKMFIWYLLQDHRDWKSGLLEQSGARKPAAKAFEDAVRGR